MKKMSSEIFRFHEIKLITISYVIHKSFAKVYPLILFLIASLQNLPRYYHLQIHLKRPCIVRQALYCFCDRFLPERLPDLHEHNPVDEARVHLSSPIDNRTMRWRRPRVIIRIPLLQPKPKKKVDLQNMIIHSIMRITAIVVNYIYKNQFDKFENLGENRNIASDYLYLAHVISSPFSVYITMSLCISIQVTISCTNKII